MKKKNSQRPTSDIQRPTGKRTLWTTRLNDLPSAIFFRLKVERWTLGVGRSLLAFAFLALLLSPLRADESSSRFLWDQANARMAAARAPADFLDAARTYNQLVADGVRNGPLFYNLGTALLLAGDGENAAAALRRAERYLGSTPEIRVNLRQALALQSGQPDADLPWDHVVFFWHYDEPLRVRAQIALYGWLLLWLALLLRLLTCASFSGKPSGNEREGERPREPRHRISGRLRSLANVCLFFGLLLFLVFLASAAFSLLQEQMDNRTWSERTFVSKSTTEQTP